MSLNPRWAKEPWKFLVENVDYLKKGSVIDLGGSDGVNDIFLAEKGFSVKNVDRDAQAVGDFLKLARDRGLAVEGEVADLNVYNLKQVYDNILSFYTLHFLEKQAALRLINDVNANTSNGGINMFIFFTENGEFNVSKGFYPKPEFISQMYEDLGWKIITMKTEFGTTKSGLKQERCMFIVKKLLS